MIIGNGLIAKAFKECQSNFQDFVIFASGVSDSNEIDDAKFNRERELLINTIKQNPDKKIIYFTSVLTTVDSNKYYNHKKEMTEIIINSKNDYIIYRVPQLIGKIGNQSNLINTIKNNIINFKETIIYEDIYRAVIDICDLVDMVNYSKNKVNNTIVNISYIEKLQIAAIVHIIAGLLKRSASCKIKKHTDKLKNWYVQNSLITIEWLIINNIKTKGYTAKVLGKYL